MHVYRSRIRALLRRIGAKVDAQGFKNSWVGYKLHVDSTEAAVPVSCILSSASLHDSQVAIPLADMSAQRVTYLYECMDSTYDAAQIHDHSRKHDSVSIIDTSSRSNKGLREALARERKAANRAGFVHPTVQRYGERTAVERVNGRLKNAVVDLDRLPNQIRPPPDCLHNAGCTDMPEAWEGCARRLGLNGFFVESGLDSAENPKESRRVETENLITI